MGRSTKAGIKKQKPRSGSSRGHDGFLTKPRVTQLRVLGEKKRTGQNKIKPQITNKFEKADK